uniref:F-box domain-containing protein n=1 Tax=Aegilops tauschii TaxID=37682 RepID=R7W5K0_AEGTA
MAAVPVGAPPPAKRKKEGPDCLETSPVPPAMVGADWSSLPYDLLRRIADTLLDTNDVDCYMDLRAVCRHWRSTTDDPRSDATDPRFRPRQWIVLDEVFPSDTRRLLVNTSSGRCLHRELPQLRDHHVVTTTLGGFFVLSDKSPPHAARVFNPLTGGLIRFNAPVPPERKVTAAVCFGMASPMLTLLTSSLSLPLTIYHLIMSYTINVRDSELASQQMPFGEVFDEDEPSPMFMDGGLHLDELYHQGWTESYIPEVPSIDLGDDDLEFH